jgi:REP element-mobilizing transposase RayT
MYRQLTMNFPPGWGGARRGAGRKPGGTRAGEAHGKRPAVEARHPVHLTMRVAGVPSLRSERCMNVMRRAFSLGKERARFRLVQYAVQSNHLHLIVEAGDKRALSGGARGLAIRIARRLNAMLGRSGRVFADRYHAVELGSARQVRNALAYVLLQSRRHAAQRQEAMTSQRDRCSSAPLFDGFTSGVPRDGPWRDTIVPAESWVLRVGWRRYGAIDLREVPGAASTRARSRRR